VVIFIPQEWRHACYQSIDMRNDIFCTLRSLRKSPGFAIVAILTLALGVGANTAIFSVIKSVLLSPLPYGTPQRLMAVSQGDAHTQTPGTTSFGTLVEWRARTRLFDSLVAYRDWGLPMTGAGDAELVRGLRVSAGFFDTLDVPMQLGRNFTEQEDHPNTRQVLILSDGFWKTRFGGNPAVIGQSITLGGIPFKIVGVLPAKFRTLGFRYASTPDVFGPLGYDVSQPFACRSCQHLRVLGRVKPGVSAASAQAELSQITGDLARTYPRDYSPDARALSVPLQTYFVGSSDKTLWLLLGAVGLLLLIACANVANLLLARAIGRRKELALRAAIGASRMRLIRQMVTESLVLAAAGGAAGLVLAIWAIDGLKRLGADRIPRIEEVSLDIPVLLFAFAVATLCGFLFGTAPALEASRVDVNEALKDGARGTESRRRVRQMLVIGELALAFVMISGTGLLLKSLVRLLDLNPGFDPKNTITMTVNLSGPNLTTNEQIAVFNRELLQKIRTLPGVAAAGLAGVLPLGGSFDRASLHIRDRFVPEGQAPSPDRYIVSVDYLRAMRIPVLRGRAFTDQDHLGTEPVAMISETAARQIWPNEEPIGKFIELGGRSEKGPWFRIVGIVGDVRQVSLDQERQMQAYLPDAQVPLSGFTLVVRGAGNLAKSVRDTIRGFDRNQPVYDIATMEERIAVTMAQRRLALILLALFAGLALVLAVVGVYGLMAYLVGLRRREFGIRAALGASRSQTAGLVVAEATRLIGAGLALGLFISVLVSQWLRGMLFAVSPIDLWVSASVVAILGTAGILATWLPARAAAEIDPSTLLRAD
jgi:putative ABC transport system permease protein